MIEQNCQLMSKSLTSQQENGSYLVHARPLAVLLRLRLELSNLWLNLQVDSYHIGNETNTI